MQQPDPPAAPPAYPPPPYSQQYGYPGEPGAGAPQYPMGPGYSSGPPQQPMAPGYPGQPGPYEKPMPQGYPSGQPGYPVQPGHVPQPMPPGYPTQPIPQHYPQPMQGQPTVHLVQQAPVVGMRFGEVPVPMTCQYCSASIITGTRKTISSVIWLAAGAICFAGCFLGGITWFGCCLIPFCIDSLKDTVHFCPNCNRSLGRHGKAL